jgi:hypothetical protein
LRVAQSESGVPVDSSKPLRRQPWRRSTMKAAARSSRARNSQHEVAVLLRRERWSCRCFCCLHYAALFGQSGGTLRRWPRQRSRKARRAAVPPTWFSAWIVPPPSTYHPVAPSLFCTRRKHTRGSPWARCAAPRTHSTARCRPQTKHAQGIFASPLLRLAHHLLRLCSPVPAAVT